MTLLELIGQRAHSSPDGQYFNVYGETYSYGRVWSQSLRYAAGFASAGVRAGDNVCLIYPTCAEFFYAFLGAMRLGAVPVPLYPTMGIEATARIFRNSDAVAVATTGWFRREIEEAATASTRLKVILEPPDLDVECKSPALPEARPEDVAFIQYTSGSTREPRGVVLSHLNLLETVEFMSEASGLTARDRLASWLPLYHDMGLIGCGLVPPFVGAPVWLMSPDLRNPRAWLELVSDVRATVTASPDFGYRNCVRNIKDPSGLDLSSLKSAFSGSEPVRPATIESFEKKFNVQNVVAPCYGLAEATLGVAFWRAGTPIRLDRKGKFVSVGRPCRSVLVRIMPTSPLEGGELSPNLEGEIWVKSPGVMQGYYNDPDATSQVLMPGGWLRTGDLGFLDADGYLFVTGRLKDTIILGGENVSPADVEAITDQVEGVRYSAAVGVDSERSGTQRLYVVAELRESTVPSETLATLTGHIVRLLHENLSHRPARVFLVRPGTIPKTSSGKVQRSRLGQMILDQRLSEHLVQGRPDRK